MISLRPRNCPSLS